jgi:hypothetical protein
VKIVKILRHEAANGTRHKPRRNIDNGRRNTSLASDSRDFQADESPTDDDESLCFREFFPERQGISDGSQIAYPIQIYARDYQRPMTRAGGKHEVIVGELLSRMRPHPPSSPLNGYDLFTAKYLDFPVVEELRWSEG